MRHVYFLSYVLKANLMMTPCVLNIELNELFYKVVFDCYLFISSFVSFRLLRHRKKKIFSCRIQKQARNSLFCEYVFVCWFVCILLKFMF
jgi:hypothetical protein